MPMKWFLLLIISSCTLQTFSQNLFVTQKNGQLFLNGTPYHYIGTNYWYGSLLALQKEPSRGIGRLRKELDFLKENGITNLRVMAGAEGSGIINGISRVGPPLQVSKGVFDTTVLYGLDVLLDEMDKRSMKAVIFFSNNWEWSGGFLQYLDWNNIISDSVLHAPMNWDDMRDHISKFYTCRPCMDDYKNQVALILGRRNSVNGRKYTDDPAIMSWELANEPRPMRPASDDAYKQWIAGVAAFIKSRDRNHLVCLGHEGEIGTQNMHLYKVIHSDKNIDYLTIHIWPKNWGWMKIETMQQDKPVVDSLTQYYINRHLELAAKLQKPLVIEEFGLPRDSMKFEPGTSTTCRDKYYELVFHFLTETGILNNQYLAGISFWAFNGTARPAKGRVNWKPGDDYMGDPPMEQQSLYGVYDSDASTWKLVRKYIKKLKQ